MQKIPTLFERDETCRGRPVVPQVKSACRWVLDGDGVATRKLDGTNVRIEAGRLFKRHKPASGVYDHASYVEADRTDPADRWAFVAFDAFEDRCDGIYELIGPKIQGNPEWRLTHTLVRVLPFEPWLVVPDAPRSFDGLAAFLAEADLEGLVFHHPDGRLAKIKTRDFGLTRRPPDRPRP